MKLIRAKTSNKFIVEKNILVNYVTVCTNGIKNCIDCSDEGRRHCGNA